MVPRSLKIPKTKSFFLFGARGTGKSWLLTQLFAADKAVHVDLLDPALADRLIAYPNTFSDMIAPYIGKKPWVIVDEVQKVPKLLELVHQAIAKRQFHFAMSGSSARKLKRGAANLLAGRANVFHLFPFTHVELGTLFDLGVAVSFGTLPDVALAASDLDRQRFLKAYVQTYLREEIVAEQVVRNLPPFRRFLDVAAQQNAEPIHLTNIAKDVGSEAKTISNYFDILEDTLLGMRLPTFERSVRKRQKAAAKFYFIDPGVVRALTGQIDYRAVARTPEFGKLFETWLINETHRILSYKEKQFSLSYINVDDRAEVDLVIERAREPLMLCEIKATDQVDERHVAGVETVGKALPTARRVLISNDIRPKKIGATECLHWSRWLADLAAG